MTTLAPSQPAASGPEPHQAPSTASTSGAIVIGGDHRGLGIARSLGRRGIPVWIATGSHSIAAHSRYSHRRIRWPRSSEERQVNLLLELSSETGPEPWALIPTSDETAAMISRNHSLLSQKFISSVGPWEDVRDAHDKRLSHTLADSLQIPRPWTAYPSDAGGACPRDCPFPVIVKPAVKNGFNALTHDKAWKADDPRSLRILYERALDLMPARDIMIQELIPGNGRSQLSFAALADRGKCIVLGTACRVRQFPAEFGHHSTWVETTEDAEIESFGRRIVEAMRYTGLIEIEFKRDPRTGEAKLLDINARVWGWHSIGSSRSFDFVYLLWQLLHGQEIAERRLPAGILWTRLTTDFPSALRQIASRELSVARYLRSLAQHPDAAVWAPDDPVPALLDLPLLARLSLRRRAL